MKQQLDLQAIRQRLINVRQSMGLSQQKVAQDLGYANNQVICHLEIGRTQLKLQTFCELAEYYGIEREWLLTGEQSK
jgi:transcriptional regulator with XRE-family HTH domain